jgi:YbbR domain-containing protein
VDPRTVHVEIALLNDKESRTLPVNPVVTGTPAPGFRVVGVTSVPLAVLVEGEAEDVRALAQVDTTPVTVNGATGDVAQRVTLALPTGIVAKGSGAVTVRVTIEAVTGTRTYTAGLRLDGRQPGLEYRNVEEQVNLTLFGPVATLDELSAAPLEVSVNVAGLEPGAHQVTAAPVVPSGVTEVEISPPTVTVIVTALPSPQPSPDPAALSPSPLASGSQPSASP